MVTITSSREIEAVFQRGRRYATQEFVALVAPTPEGRGPQGRVAFIAGKKLGNAVKRNRSKRVMREAVRRAGGPWTGHDVVLIARDAVADATAERLDRDLEKAMRRAGLA